jgi:hypothetical protein
VAEYFRIKKNGGVINKDLINVSFYNGENDDIEEIGIHDIDVFRDKIDTIAYNKVCKIFLANDVVESPNEDRIPYVWKMIYGSQEHEGMFHRSGFTEKSLESLLRKFGFEIMLKYSSFPNRSTPSLCVIAVKNEI